MEEKERQALSIIQEEISRATLEKKCHPCRCFHKTVEAIEKTGALREELGTLFSRARSVMHSEDYDCLGCEVCYPAIAARAFAAAFPSQR